MDEVMLYMNDNDEATCGFKLDPNASDDDRWITTADMSSGAGFINSLMLGEDSYKAFTLNRGESFTMDVYGLNDGYVVKEINYYRTALTPGDNKVFYMHLDRMGYQPPFFGMPDEAAA